MDSKIGVYNKMTSSKTNNQKPINQEKQENKLIKQWLKDEETTKLQASLEKFLGIK